MNIIKLNQLPDSDAKVAAWFPDMFCNFYLVENTKLLICQQPPKLDIFGVCLTKLKDNQILVNKFDTNF